ncbi:unnamed protein product [Durusdinium trenchii]|uniref:Peptidyl-tRNA hydrolase n=2 Tax=Durusdinium trenchii TaxID=1381693 RepID=A0ABP0J2X9_9DINO
MANVSPAQIKTKLCKIEVPQVVLDKDDCDPSMVVPSPGTWEECTTLPQPTRRLTFPVPTGSEEGCILNIPLQDGTKLAKELPHGLNSGEMVLAFQRPDGDWRMMKKPAEFAFVVPPDATPGAALKPQLPDGTYLHFEVPESVGPGNLIELQHQGSWQLKRVVELTEVQQVPAQSNTIRGPFLAALDTLRQSVSLKQLVPDASGILGVNVPFCGRFQEYAMLGNFLAEHCLTLPGIKGARIFGCDMSDRYYYDWAVARRWFAEFHPMIEVHLQVRDLHLDPLPKAGLTIALHPEVTKGGSWFPIMGSVIKASQNGICLIASFFQDEAKTLMNMVDMYDEGRAKLLVENTYWKESAESNVAESVPSKRMNFLLLLPPSSQTKSMNTSYFQWFGRLVSAICGRK